MITPVRNTKTLRLPIRPLDVVSDANVSQFIRAGNKRREYSYLCHKLGAYEKSEFLLEFDLVVSKNVGWLLWALSDSATPGERPGDLCHILVSFQSDSPFPRLARKISLWWRNWIERLSFGSKHCTWPIRNVLTAPRKYWDLEIAQGIYSYTAVSRNVHATILKGIVDGFDLHCSTKKFERMAQEATDMCSRVLKGSNKSKEQCTD